MARRRVIDRNLASFFEYSSDELSGDEETDADLANPMDRERAYRRSVATVFQLVHAVDRAQARLADAYRRAELLRLDLQRTSEIDALPQVTQVEEPDAQQVPQNSEVVLVDPVPDAVGPPIPLPVLPRVRFEQIFNSLASSRAEVRRMLSDRRRRRTPISSITYQFPHCIVCYRDISDLWREEVSCMNTVCGHLICAECANSLLLAARATRLNLGCPACRHPIYDIQRRDRPGIFSLHI